VIWIDYLRSFITILVIAHHSSLAYTTFAKSDKEAYILSTHPIVDSRRFIGLDIFENFNDVFFMALMFLIGGIFIVKSLQKKGIARFIRDRFYRLFIPFMFTVTLLMPLAYYPAYHMLHPSGGIRNFIVDFIMIEGWPPGPPWFIWVLFLFNCLVAFFSKRGIPLMIKAGRWLDTFKNRSFAVFGLFFMVSWILYVPASWIFGAYSWTGIGPFDFQKSRFLLYFSFFIIGCIVGYPDPESGLFSADSLFVKKWRIWLRGCIIFYGLLLFLEALGRQGIVKTIGFWPARIIYGTVYDLSTCFSCVAFLSIFRKFVTQSNSLWNSLCDNAYCMYLIHYIFVIWCQYDLLGAALPAIFKFAITFIFATAASWLLSISLRKLPVIKAYI
jgi:glucan biosynthesis protein C